MKSLKILALVCGLCFMSNGVCLADQEDPKSPGLAFLLSLVLPAGGQYYDEDIPKGLIFDAGIGLGVLVTLVGAGNSNTFTQQEEQAKVGVYAPDPNVTTTTIGVVTAASFWIVSMIDAPGSADSYNRKHRQDSSTWEMNLSPMKSLASPKTIPAMTLALHF